MNSIEHTCTFKIYVVITKSIYQIIRLNFMIMYVKLLVILYISSAMQVYIV